MTEDRTETYRKEGSLRGIRARFLQYWDQLGVTSGWIDLGMGMPTIEMLGLPLPANLDSNARRAEYQPQAGELALREAIAAYETQRTGLPLTSRHVMSVAGAIRGFSLVLDTLVGRWRNSLIRFVGVRPTYPVLAGFVSQLAERTGVGAVVTEVPWIQRELACGDLIQYVQPSTVFFLTNPNNPTGLYVPTDVLTELVSACEAVGSYVVVDEACDIPLTPGWRDRRWPYSAALIRIGSFSKQYLLAGFRLGYIVAVPDLIDEFASMYAFANGNAPVVANAEVRRLLEDDELSARIAESARARVKFALRRLNRWSRVRSVIEPHACYYIFLELDVRHDSWTLFTHLLRAGVNVVPGELFGLAGQPPWIRICVGRSEEILTTGLDRLRIGLQALTALPSA